MAITFRANKGEALTYKEMDTNLGSYFYSSSLTKESWVANSATRTTVNFATLFYTGSTLIPWNLAAHQIPLHATGSRSITDLFNMQARAYKQVLLISYLTQ